MLPLLNLLLILLLSYMLGSLPTSLIAGRAAAGLDIREHGSGNAGATNVYRVLGIGWAIGVALVDVGKGTAAALLLSRLDLGSGLAVSQSGAQLLAGGAAVAGHVWTIFGGFRGGKGVATAVGALIGIIPAALAASLAVWVLLLFTVRIMSVASLAAAVVLPVAVWIWESEPDGTTDPGLIWATVLLAALIFYTHRANIRRLLRGEEKTLRAPGNGSGPGGIAMPREDEEASRPEGAAREERA